MSSNYLASLAAMQLPMTITDPVCIYHVEMLFHEGMIEAEMPAIDASPWGRSAVVHAITERGMLIVKHRGIDQDV